MKNLKSIEEKMQLQVNESRAEMNKAIQEARAMNLKIRVPEFIPVFKA